MSNHFNHFEVRYGISFRLTNRRTIKLTAVIVKMENKEFDICIFGVTGVTGKYILKELRKSVGDDKAIKYAVSGRSVEKVKSVLRECGDEYKNIPIIEADVKDGKSLADMCKRCKVILNAVGPYRFFGEQVVKACVENGSHHLDVSGEPQFLETMQIKYDDAAKKAGVYIVGACGMDSIPCDMGVQFVKDQFQGDLNSVETYISLKTGPKGYNVNLGTWNSLIHGVAHFSDLKDLRKELTTKMYPKGLPKLSPKLKHRGLMFKSESVKAWCFPFLGSDKSISIRSQMSNYDIYNDRPVHIQTYMKLPSFFAGMVLAFMASIFGLLTKFSFGRHLLTTYPGFFSLGLFKEGGPNEEQMKDARFTLELFAEGWSEKLDNPSAEHSDKPNKRLRAKVTGPDPGYFLTSISIVQSGLTVLKESDKMPLTGGVFTTATAFKNTNLISNLHKSGLEFNVISN